MSDEETSMAADCLQEGEVAPFEGSTSPMGGQRYGPVKLDDEATSQWVDEVGFHRDPESDTSMEWWYAWTDKLRLGSEPAPISLHVYEGKAFWSVNESVIVRRADLAAHIAQEALAPGTGLLAGIGPRDQHGTPLPGDFSDYVQLEVEDAGPDEIAAAQASGVAIVPNLVFFAAPMIGFRPGEGPKPGAGYDPEPLGTSTGRVVTIDTGDINPTVRSPIAYVHREPTEIDNHDVLFKSKPPNSHIDDYDEVIGHGPAIADLIGRLLGDPSRSALQRVLYEESVALPVPVTHEESALRAFDSVALLATLETERVRQEYDVINLSLSGPGCDLVRAKDSEGEWVWPIARWLQRIAENGNRPMVVAAAGNSGSTQEEFPAGFAMDFPEVIVSVGSTDSHIEPMIGSTAEPPSDFSNRGPWVTAQACGRSVAVWHPMLGAVTWTGTSFATPQVSAILAADIGA